MQEYFGFVLFLSPSDNKILLPIITDLQKEYCNQPPFEPHYQSDHPESKSIDIEIQHCVDNKILFKAYRDGEVLIV